MIRSLDDESVTPPDRLRLLILYVLYRDGILPADLQKLLAHAQLPPQEEHMIHNLDLLGARSSRGLKDSRPPSGPLFPRKPPPMNMQDEYALSRFEPVLQEMLEAAATNTLDPQTFPYTKPPLDMGNEPQAASVTSLRATASKPTWARGGARAAQNAENRQRCIVFIAGGATYSESRACYQTAAKAGREVFLVTSHMLTPALFVRQVNDLSQDRRMLGIPADQPKKQAPKHLFEPDEQPRAPQPVQQAPPQQQRQQQSLPQQMGSMSLNGGGSPAPVVQRPVQANSSAKLTKEAPGAGGEKEKKKHKFFGRSKDK